jgi:UDP-glucose 4-epimerase
MNRLTNKKCLVTGGAGFVGSHLVDHLLREGAVVTVFDNLTAGKLAHIPADVAAMSGDLRDAEAVRAACKGSDIIFHLAARASVQDSIEHPREYFEVNVLGTMNVLEAARLEAQTPRVILASSAAVYGDQDIVKVHEELTPQPKSPYALHKRMTEEMAALWSNLYGVETVSIRPFNIYGTRMNPDGPYAGVIGRLMKMRAEGQPLSLTGDGEQTRDFVHVSDMAEAYVLAATSASVGHGEIINIASGTSVSLNMLAKLIGGEVSYIPARVGDIVHSGADITRAATLLGYVPQVSLKEGIRGLKQSLAIA